MTDKRTYEERKAYILAWRATKLEQDPEYFAKVAQARVIVLNRKCSCGKRISRKGMNCRSCAMKGIKKSPEHIAKLRIPKSLETKEKLKIAKQGKTYEEIYPDANYILAKKRQQSELMKKRHSLGLIPPVSVHARKANHSGIHNGMFGKSGLLSPVWKGGKSFESYGLAFTAEFKERIRIRDGRCCAICEISELSLSKKLQIHHVDYVKINTFLSNCISLCPSCHIKTNNNRESWQAYFKSLMTIKYGYAYSEEQKSFTSINNLIKGENYY